MALWDRMRGLVNWESLKQKPGIATIVAYYDALPADQKHIANIAGISGAALLLLLFVFMGNAKVQSLREDIEAKSRNLREFSKYQEEFSEQAQILQSLEKKAKLLGQDFSLLSALEQMAQNAQIDRQSIESISPKQLPPGDYFIETEATVELVKVSLRQLVQYFYLIESSPNNLILREVRTKPRFDNAEFLNVTFKVTSYKPKE